MAPSRRELSLVLVLLGFCSASNSTLDLTLFNDDVVKQFSAVCLDGSPAGFYFRAAPKGSPNADKFTIFLQGGGFCASKQTCQGRSRTILGSSTNWKPQYEDDNHITSSDQNINPTFHDFNHVFLRYCSGDVWAGTQNTTNSFGLQFSGHNIMRAAIATIPGLDTASAVLLSGHSAGGIGTFIHADYVREALPHATVRAAPEGGFFYPGGVTTYEDFKSGTKTPFAPLQTLQLIKLYDGFVDVSCAASQAPHNVHLCASAHYLYPYVEAPLFVVQNRFDKNQLDSLGMPADKKAPDAQNFEAFYGNCTQTDIETILSSPKKDGVFSPSCFAHTGDLCISSDTKIKGIRYGDALSSWWDGDNKTPTQLVDDCGDLPCNPLCTGPCSG